MCFSALVGLGQFWVCTEMELQAPAKCEVKNAATPVIFQQHRVTVWKRSIESLQFELSIENPHISLKSCFSSGLPGWPCSDALKAFPFTLPQQASQMRWGSHPPQAVSMRMVAESTVFKALFLLVLCKYSEDMHQNGSWHIKHNFLGRTRWDWAQNSLCSKNYKLDSH